MELKSFIETKDGTRIKAVLQDTINLRSVVIQRGAKGSAHKVFQQAFEFLVEEKFGKGKSVIELTAGELIDFLHVEKLPEQILNSIESIAFHSEDKGMFFGVVEKIIQNQELFFDRETVLEAYHDLASWKSSYENDKIKAIELNKAVLAECEKIGAETLRKKALFGIAHNKQVKFKHKVERFKKVSEEFGDRDNALYNKLRTEIAHAENLLLYAKLKTGLHKSELLKEAKEKTLKALKESIATGYLKAEMKTSELLGEIYAEAGDERKAKSFQKRAETLLKELY